MKLALGEHTYRKVYNSEFNLRFGLPRSDTCANCDRLNLALKSDPGDAVAHQQLADHQDKEDKGYQNILCGETKTRPLIAGVAIPVL